MPLNPRHYSLMLLMALGLVGCGDDRRASVAEICRNQPALCDDLNDDSWCRFERANVIEHRFLAQNGNPPEQQYLLLKGWEKYRDCMVLAAEVKKKENTAISANRTKGYLTSLAELEKLDRATANSSDPFLLYWHWSRHGQQQALEQLQALDQAGKLEFSELQFHLGSYYAKYEMDIAVKKMMRALELLPAHAPYLQELLGSLATLYYRKNDGDRAYLWLRIAELAEVQGANAQAVIAQFQLDDARVNALNDKAKTLFKQIEERKFVPPR